jgi:hypothetical protein
MEVAKGFPPVPSSRVRAETMLSAASKTRRLFHHSTFRIGADIIQTTVYSGIWTNQHLLGFLDLGKPSRIAECYDDERDIQVACRRQTVPGLLHYRARRPPVTDFHDHWRLQFDPCYHKFRLDLGRIIGHPFYLTNRRIQQQRK